MRAALLIAAAFISPTIVGQNDSCEQATPFQYFHCENFPVQSTYSATLCYSQITAASFVDYTYGYTAFCPDLSVSYTLYNSLCMPLETNSTGSFDIAPGVQYIVCGTVTCGDSAGLGIAQVCTVEMLALPVEFIGMTAYPTDAGVTLAWSTASERASERFEVFRMRTELDRGTLLTSLRAAGYSQSRRDYRWTDVEPIPGIAFYRLEGVDLNGVRTILQVLPVRWERGADRGKLYPFDSSGRLVH